MDTKDRILNAFNQLASHRDFDSITVFQIAGEAAEAMYEILPSFLKTKDFENMLSHMRQ